MRFMPAALAAAAVLVPGLAHAADYAPMSCAKAESAAEKTVCGNYALGQLEARMATLYAVATSLVAMGPARRHAGRAARLPAGARELR